MPVKILPALLGSLLALAGTAAVASDFSLNEGAVTFSAPDDWPVIMQMTEGSPQVIAFQVKDPADSGTEDATRVSVTTRKLDDAQGFQAFVDAGLDKAKQTPGYESETGSDSGNLRYTGLNGKTRYRFRETYFFRNGVGVQLRCVHPLLKATSAAWTTAFNKGCDQIAATLQK
jgi:hypothetical protein